MLKRELSSCIQNTCIPFILLALFVALTTTPTIADPSEPERSDRETSVLYQEDWEEGWGAWYPDAGTWDVGEATSGPNSAHDGSKCAATNLTGNYYNNVNSRLIGPSWVLPPSPEDGQLWLRLWQWYYTASSGDYGRIEISSNGGEWEEVPGSNVFSYSGGVWTQTLYDISAYAGETVRLAFHFISDGGYANPGWYIDDVSIEEGALVGHNPEGFEAGIGDFIVTQGYWEVGQPASGPGAAHSGQTCAGTVLGGEYWNNMDTRLIFPTQTLSASPEDGQLWLSLWQWFYTASSADYGRVEISRNGGEWEEVPGSDVYRYCGGIWTKAFYDISAYAGETVRLAFHFISDGGYHNPGWYIDDVSIDEGMLAGHQWEDFNSSLPWHFWRDLADWNVLGGVWEIGEPSYGTSVAHSGTQCAGTVLGSNYPNMADARLISSEVQLPSSPVGNQLWLRFWQWIYTASSADYGQVEISRNGGEWEEVPNSDVSNYRGGLWTQALYDISAYAGETVRLAFHFISDGGYTDPGWYIDDIGLIEGPRTFRGSPDSFESGIGGWVVQDNTWEAGVPTSGPGTAYTGLNCVATRLDANYPNNVSPRFISPPFVVEPLTPGSPVLFKYKHWYSLSNDQGNVEFSVNGGDWQILDTYSGTGGGVWTPTPPIDLTAYADSTIQMAFHLVSGGSSPSSGWFIDDVEITNVDFVRPSAPQNLIVEYFEPASVPPAEPMSNPILTWRSVDDEDLACYAIYRGYEEDFSPDFGTRIALTTETAYTDLQAHGSYYHYKIAAIDTLWNESEIVSPTELVGVHDPGDDEAAPACAVLLANAPNPFNPTTSIRFGLPVEQHVRLSIFDLRGRRLQTLVDGVMPAGYHTEVFGGDGLASGIYLYRLETEQEVLCRKMTLLK
ncbi:MAG: hypothetical protein GY835_01010 [bacterium]|nr:hypothetical protein [bacterium]